MKQGRFITWGAIAATAVGLAFTAVAFSRVPDLKRHTKTRAVDFDQLVSMAEEQVMSREALATLEPFAQHPIRSIETVAAEVLEGAQPEIRHRDPVPVLDGWALYRVDVSLSEFDLRLLPELVREAENELPPWRLTECSIIASPQSAGYGQVSLVFDTLRAR